MKIVVLHHKYADSEQKPELIRYLCHCWQEQGHTVVHVNGVDIPLPVADVLILHVNLTVVPPEYIRAVERFPVVINRSVVDISKPSFSQIMLKEDDHHAGPVIVKSKYNFGGIPERRTGLKNDDFGNLISRFCRQFKIPGTWRNIRHLKKYRVFGSLQEVPRGVWQNEHLIVEKFIPERDPDGNYCIREWIFFGDREIHYLNISREPVIRGINAYHRKYLTEDDVPDSLREARKSLGLDYGKIDYVIKNELPVILDINKTIGVASNTGEREGVYERIAELSLGLAYYLNKKVD